MFFEMINSISLQLYLLCSFIYIYMYIYIYIYYISTEYDEVDDDVDDYDAIC